MSRLAVFFLNYPFYMSHMEKDVGLFPLYFKRLYFTEAEILVTGQHRMEQTVYDGITVKPLFRSPETYCRNHRNGALYQIKCLVKSIAYVRRNKDITHIMLFHFHLYSNLFFAYFVKKMRPDIHIYDKLDTSVQGAQSIVGMCSGNSKKAELKRKLVSAVDLFSVETEEPYALLQQCPAFSGRICCVPDGYDDSRDGNTELPDFKQKEHLLITVGRLGTFQKNTDMILSVLSQADMHDWKAVLIGPVEKDERDFQKDIDSFFALHPEMKDRILFTGNITDKTVLNQYYRRASVFFFTSRFESFALALQEAAWWGDYIVSTDTGCASDITGEGRYGFIAPDSKEFSQQEEKIQHAFTAVLHDVFSGIKDISGYMIQQMEYARSRYSMTMAVQEKMLADWAAERS